MPLAVLLTLAGPALALSRADGLVIHSATDIGHEFSFYFDGRFGAQYVESQGGADCRIWGTLRKFDLGNISLLVLSSGATPCAYTPDDIAVVRAYLEAGGGAVVLGDFATFREERDYRLNDLARAFGAEFAADAAKEPLRAAKELEAGEIECYGGRVLELAEPDAWHVLIEDSQKRPLLARRPVGKGTLLIGSRGLCGRQPDAKDPINAAWLKPLLRDVASGKTIDATRGPESMEPENAVERGGLKIRYNDYMQPYADAIFDLYTRERPVLESIIGVPPAPNMLTSLILLPTGGGGFSSGTEIGLGVFWGDFPDKLYGMIELLAHEGTHSWVLPFAEPMWNEGIATYVGILAGREMGEAEAADETLRGWLEAARKHDPDFTKLDIAHGAGVPHVVAVAKPMWIFEQLRAEKPDIIARYFQTKRELIDPAKTDRYTAEDCVAVLSLAMGRDLFPWFQSLGISVDRAKTALPVP